MKLYEIQTPAPANGRYIEHDAFKAELLRIAGGYSRRQQVLGTWRNDETGEVFREPMSPYHVALAEPARLNEIMAAASRIWPNEVAWYVAELGEVTIWPATVPGDSSPPPMSDGAIEAAIWGDVDPSYEPQHTIGDYDATYLASRQPHTVGEDYPATAPLGRIAASRESVFPGATLQAKPRHEETE